MQVKYKRYIYLLLLFILLLNNVYLHYKVNNSDNLTLEYKKELILKDSLRKKSDTHYQKLVDDTSSKEELNDLLKVYNKNLLDILKAEGKRPISYTVINSQPKVKTDTVKLIDTLNGSKTFTDYYPAKKDYFMKYSGVVTSNNVIGKWTPSNLSIGIVVSEKSKGLYEVDLDAPKWLNVKDIKVNSLPIDNIEYKKFRWVLGGNAGWNFKLNEPVVEVEGGFKINNTLYTIQSNTNKELKAGIKLIF